MAHAAPGEVANWETDSHTYAASSTVDTAEDLLEESARRQLTDSVLECQRDLPLDGEPFLQRRQLTDSAVLSPDIRAQLLPTEATDASLGEPPAWGAQHQAQQGWGWHRGRGGGPATVLLEPVPEGYTQQMLMQEIDDAGFADLYDLAYMPAGGQACRADGFALVHFISADIAEGFRRAFQGQRLQNFSARDPLRVLPADSRLFDVGAGRMHVSQLEGIWSDQGSRLYDAKRQVAAVAAAVACRATAEANEAEQGN